MLYGHTMDTEGYFIGYNPLHALQAFCTRKFVSITGMQCMQRMQLVQRAMLLCIFASIACLWYRVSLLSISGMQCMQRECN